MKKLLLLSLCFALNAGTQCMEEQAHLLPEEAAALAEEFVGAVFQDLFAALENNGHLHAAGNPVPHVLVGALMDVAAQAPEQIFTPPVIAEEDEVNE